MEESAGLGSTVMDKTLELFTKLLSGGEDPDVTALSEAINASLGITTPLVKVEASPSSSVKGLADTLMCDRSTLRLSEVGSCPNPIHPRIRSVPISTLVETAEDDLAKLGLTSLAPLAKAGSSYCTTSPAGCKPIA